jgi:protein-S-isoprenylcysteine O-methyltransferase Ste14
MHTNDPDRPAAAGPDTGAGWVLVAAQAVLLGLSAGLRSGTHWPRPGVLRAGAGVGQLAGVAMAGAAAVSLHDGLTALPYPNAHAELRTGGLFARVRHPIYTGLLLAVISRSAASGRPAQLGVAGALLVLFQVKTRIEEDALRQRFPDYDRYAATTPRLLPRLAKR